MLSHLEKIVVNSKYGDLGFQCRPEREVTHDLYENSVVFFSFI